MVRRGQWAAERADRSQRRALAAALLPLVSLEATGPPVSGGVVDDDGRVGVFVGERGGESARFVPVGNLEDQTVVEAVVVVVVDVVPVVLKGRTDG